MVARQGTVTRWGAAMAGNDAGIFAFLESVERELDAEGVNARVQRAYMTVAPLLLESEAVVHALMESDDLSLSSVLVVMGSVREAVALAEAEYRLDADDSATLALLLLREQSRLYEA
jgi:hypothetical protein